MKIKYLDLDKVIDEKVKEIKQEEERLVKLELDLCCLTFLLAVSILMLLYKFGLL